MSLTGAIDEYMGPLLAGNRTACREFVMGKLDSVDGSVSLYEGLLWPAMERVEKLFRGDRINTAAEHMATRINRAIADQLQRALPKSDSIGKRIVIACADGEPEELGAQMCSDLFESRGWEVYFLGGGVPNDEILSLIGQLRPDILLIFGTQPGGVPGVRKLIDMIREIGVNPTMNIMVSGGVFNRADGLWKEVNADLMAKSAHTAIPIAEASKAKIPLPPTAGVPKKRRRRRRPRVAAAAIDS
ncbi:MAG: cobalamin-dependent protein [Planctomycetes bacterium]|nr:cobalamin-dependent protein [Planctomycetota bacterium]